MLIAALFAGLHGALSRFRRAFWVAPALFAAFFSFQCVKAYLHAMDYRSDLAFWEATKNAVPRSAKAHLNYSVMKGARSDMQTRLSESLIALDLAPQWPMAHIYTGDALCRMGRPDDAWPHYAEGFDRSPNDTGLISLALQCLWDTGKLEAHEDELRELAEKHKGSWLAFLAVDTLDNGKEHRGVNPKYRPRSYNEGPKDE
jgi:tetratricopeptide (TPR) repeat protein